MSTPILITGAASDPTTLAEVVGQAIGAASVCWESMECTGVFDSDRARQIADEVLAYVDAHYVPRAQPAADTVVCPRCHGEGTIDPGPGAMRQPCGTCTGTGSVRQAVEQVLVLEVETSGLDVQGMPRATGPTPRA